MKDREIIVGISGGIAAYKTAALVSQLVQQGARVTVVSTKAGERFVGSATFAALSGRPVVRQLFDEESHPLGAHIAVAERGELFCVAPATANFLAKAAHGIADDVLSTIYLTFTGPVLMAPAMNSDMWEKPVVQRNVKQLENDGVHFIDPEEGWLSCRRYGAGRMASPERIAKAIGEHLGRKDEGRRH
jgi:phosphopantothenoylcysteine decarboxylase/phosphopantothenate--cysteine ligase